MKILMTKWNEKAEVEMVMEVGMDGISEEQLRKEVEHHKAKGWKIPSQSE